MLFLQAIVGLVIYDLLGIFCRFEQIYFSIKNWKVSDRKNVDPQSVERICEAINRACIWYPKQALCLQRSFVMTCLLRRRGIPAQLILGAQKFPFKAHAWVEIDGRAINERSNVQATFAVWDRC